MKAKLKIRSFGPIKNIDIELRKFNILIGPQGSGKSTISKVLCIIHSIADNFSSGVAPFTQNLLSGLSSWDEKYDLLISLLTNYRIENFIKPDSYWFFEDDLFFLEVSGRDIKIEHKTKSGNLAIRTPCYYFPAERIALPMISESLFELTYAQSTLPGYFLEFGKDFTIARKEQNIFNLPILKVEFEYRGGRNFVTLPNNQSLLLEETSSAIQANLPLLIILQYPTKPAALFVIEELELHGFPILQKELLYYIVERTKHPKLDRAYVMLPTHSPYILSAANNLLFAAKVAKQNSESEIEADKIIKRNSWIEREDFSAYYIVDGKAISIINEKTGLIDENELDGISENLAGEFDALMDLYKPAIA